MHFMLTGKCSSLKFLSFDCFVKFKEATKNYWFNIFVYEGHDPGTHGRRFLIVTSAAVVEKNATF
jgi:hypothetical protein